MNIIYFIFTLTAFHLSVHGFPSLIPCNRPLVVGTQIMCCKVEESDREIIVKSADGEILASGKQMNNDLKFSSLELSLEEVSCN